ncbi:DUF6002 family protein [Planotetraspora sp. GP83]|uniref:DUF6002 family protein n=1 Tax=Planotetraspora sp. GP83 TaxID=3156264 RepID=UPI0035114F82
MSETAAARTLVVNNVIERYYGNIQHLLCTLAGRGAGNDFNPGFELPPLDDEMVRFFAPSSVAVHSLAGYRGSRLALLDLMRNPGTRTTKSLASLIMVARAVEHVRRTGRRVMLLTPSSANKATALRDAVLRALRCGLVESDQLQITTVVPESSYPKLWSSPLSTDPVLRVRNPVVVYQGPDPAGVKALARRFYDKYAGRLRELTGADVWYTLDIDNYRCADAVRALFEYDFHAPDETRGRLHVHSVSSAYGLLGHALGHARRPGAGAPPRYFLVQHLGTPDMVLSLLYGSASRDLMPAYEYDAAAGLYRQAADPHFPHSTYDPAERLDPTFYTHNPPTSAAMNELIRTRGGGGVVVSLHECLGRYAEIRALLGGTSVTLPADPRRLREWSLVMAFTGVLNAIDRGLVDDDDILVHGSGSYSDEDFCLISPEYLHMAGDVAAVKRAVCDALAVRDRITLPELESVG